LIIIWKYEKRFGIFVYQNDLYMVQIDLKALSKAVTFKRDKQLEWSIRKTAPKIGINFATLSRIEAGKMPELNNYAKVCYWLGVAMETFFVPIKRKK
jgi:DNA-binding Xre family transcriptional regulator